MRPTTSGPSGPTLGFSKPARVDDAVAAVDIELAKDEMDYMEELYVTHELVGLIGRPGEKPIAGTIRPKA